MKLNRLTLGLLAATTATVLMGCEAAQTEKDMLADAQYCLDKATAATANQCMGKISGLTSPQAYALRCAAGFITAGVTSPQNLGDAMTAISSGAGTTTLLSAISFPSTATASTTFDHCNKSEQSGLALIGAMAKSATVLASAAANLGSCSSPTGCDAAQITSTIDDIVADLSSGDAATKAAAEQNVLEIVSAVTTVYTTTCTGATTVNEDLCTQINDAATVAGVDIATIPEDKLLDLGKELLAQWK